MRRLLDRIYGGALALAALALVTIALLVLIQVAGRMADRAALSLGLAPPGISVPSLAEIGGFLFVGAAFLGLAGTFRNGGHVRVTMLARVLPERAAPILAVIAIALALGLAVFATWNAGAQALDSYTFASVSYGMVRVPLWIPQGVMTLGLGVFTLALADDLVTALAGDVPAWRAAEIARESTGAADGH